MAATTPRVTAFWGAFLNVLLRCIAALGFATPARMKAAADATAGPVSVPAPVGSATENGAGRASGAPSAAPPNPAGQIFSPPASLGRASASPIPVGQVFLPAPRPYERGHSLPPTMKQRIRAEAHGTSPSARSVAVPADGFSDVVAEQDADALIPGARRRDRALCG